MNNVTTSYHRWAEINYINLRNLFQKKLTDLIISITKNVR
jgi:hypothetical protein